MVRTQAKRRISRNLCLTMTLAGFVLAHSVMGCAAESSKTDVPASPDATSSGTATPGQASPEDQSDTGAVAYQLNICSDSLADIREALQQVGPEAKGDSKTIVEEASVMAEDLGIGLEEIIDDVEKIPETDKNRWQELFTELSDALVDLEALGERLEILATSDGRGGVTDRYSKLTESYETSWAAMDESIDLAARIAGVNREVPQS